MKRKVMSGLAVILLMFGLSGCCKQFFPKKIVFVPEVNMGIQEEMERLNMKDPIILVVDRDGTTFAMTKEGELFMPCRAPDDLDKEDELSSDDKGGKLGDKGRTRSGNNTKGAISAGNVTTGDDQAGDSVIDEADLPICEGMVDLKRIYDVFPITIMHVRKNPYCSIVHNPRGGLCGNCSQ